MKFSIKDFFSAFTEETLQEKLHFLCSVDLLLVFRSRENIQISESNDFGTLIIFCQ